MTTSARSCAPTRCRPRSGSTHTRRHIPLGCEATSRSCLARWSGPSTGPGISWRPVRCRNGPVDSRSLWGCPSCTWPRRSTSSVGLGAGRRGAKPFSCTPSRASPTTERLTTSRHRGSSSALMALPSCSGRAWTTLAGRSSTRTSRGRQARPMARRSTRPVSKRWRRQWGGQRGSAPRSMAPWTRRSSADHPRPRRPRQQASSAS